MDSMVTPFGDADDTYNNALGDGEDEDNILKDDIKKSCFFLYQDTKVLIRMQILQVTDKIFCVEFSKLSGSADLFIIAFKYFKNNILIGFCDVEPADVEQIMMT